MNKLAVIGIVLGLSACAGYQAKLDSAQAKAKDAADKVICRAKVIKPYVEFTLEADLPAILDGADISDIMAMSGEAKDEVEKVKAAFAACGKL